MKEKGFTLIELLAVIVILAIIALIAVPIIIDIIEDSKKEALKRSAENYLKAVELAIAKENLNDEFNPTSCTITSGEVTCGGAPLNITVDGEIPESGTIKLQDATIVRNQETFLTYKSGTLTYDSNGKLIIEAPKKELIAEGERINETTNGVAINVDNQLVYYVPNGSTEAIVYGYRGNIDYSDNTGYFFQAAASQTSGNVEIASKVKINGETYNVTSIGNSAFSGMTGGASLTSIIIPSSVTSISDGAFVGCSNLNSIIIPESVTSIGNRAFANCTNLSVITIPSTVTTLNKDMFDNTPWFETQKQSAQDGLVIVNGILIDGSAATGDITIPSTVKVIAEDSFHSNRSINNVTVSEGVLTIKSHAFYTSSIKSITVPSTVTDMTGAFTWSDIATININKPYGTVAGYEYSFGAEERPITINWAS